MSRIVVGRIFWKEVRTQRSLWLGALCLAVGIQALLTVLAVVGGMRVFDFPQAAAGIFLAAYGAVTIYAIASGAASFTEEREGRTALFLRTIPLKPADAFAGKWAYGLGSTGLLLLVLVVAGATCTLIAWNGLPPTAGTAKPMVSSPGFGPMPAYEVAMSVWIGLVIPIVAFAVSAFFSLLFSDGVLAALSGLFTTIFVLSTAWLVNSAGGSSSSYAQLISAIALAAAGADYWLTGIWLRRDSVVQGGRGIGTGPHGRQFWFRLTQRRFDSVAALRLGDPVVPWRRAAQRLIWKECAQAWPYTKIILFLAVLTTALATLWPWGRVAALPWLVALTTPLVMGVGAYHAEQKDGGYRLLGHHAISADGAWIIKHVVWISHAAAACVLVLLIHEIGWLLRPHYGLMFSRDVGEAVYHFFRRHPPHPRVLRDSLLYESMSIALLYLALGYSIGQRLSFSYAKGTMAFALTAGLTLATCVIWSVFGDRGIPIGWSIGLIPLALLADTWAHTQRWQTQRVSPRRWYDVAFWTLLPFAGIFVALYLYLPIRIH